MLSDCIVIKDDECLQYVKQLVVEHHKNLEEISIITYLYTYSTDIEKLLKNTNYNKIQKIQLSYNHSENKMYKTPQKKDNNDYLIENIMDLYYIKNDEVYEKYKNLTLNMMYKVGNKYNKNFMDYNIFSQLEKFLCNKDKKTIIFQ